LLIAFYAGFYSTFYFLGAGLPPPSSIDFTVFPLRLMEMLILGFFSYGSSGFTSSS
jgi:hypothetical protein